MSVAAILQQKHLPQLLKDALEARHLWHLRVRGTRKAGPGDPHVRVAAAAPKVHRARSTTARLASASWGASRSSTLSSTANASARAGGILGTAPMAMLPARGRGIYLAAPYCWARPPPVE
jgi:hypothetical protein